MQQWNLGRQQLINMIGANGDTFLHVSVDFA